MTKNKFSTDTEYCLVTVCTEEFMPGTLVMIHSFLKYNTWFNGDIVIIHANLDIKYQRCIEKCYARLRFMAVSSQLDTCLQELLANRSDLTNRKARFYSLEVLRLTGYKKVLFCDSDLLFRQSIQPVFTMSGALICCGDGNYYHGEGRDSHTFLPLSKQSIIKGEVLHNTFNAGLMLFDRQLLNADAYTELLALLTKETWQNIEASHTDQVVLNLYFNGVQTLLSGSYNYLITFQNEIFSHEGVSLKDAMVLHFNGPNKPWRTRQLLLSSTTNANLLQALKYWYESYSECLTRLHFIERIN